MVRLKWSEENPVYTSLDELWIFLVQNLQGRMSSHNACSNLLFFFQNLEVFFLTVCSWIIQLFSQLAAVMSYPRNSSDISIWCTTFFLSGLQSWNLKVEIVLCAHELEKKLFLVDIQADCVEKVGDQLLLCFWNEVWTLREHYSISYSWSKSTVVRWPNWA